MRGPWARPRYSSTTHDPAAAERQPASILPPACRSPAALAKAGRKRTDDHLPVHSVRTLLTDLGTLAVNTMQIAGDGSTFTLPSRLRQRDAPRSVGSVARAT